MIPLLNLKAGLSSKVGSNSIFMKLIIGLGNPNQHYNNTRHNVGFMLLDWLVKGYGEESLKFDPKLNAETSKGKIEKTKVLFIKPKTYVNASGEVLKKIKKKEQFKPQDVIVLHDDLDIPFKKIKIKFESHSGGHKGIESITKALKTNKFFRLKIGTANKEMEKMRSAPKKQKVAFVTKFVLAPFSKSEQTKLKDIFKIAQERLEELLK